MQKAIVVIPARYGSTRLPGKALADIEGKPLVQHVYERARISRLASDCLIATDDERIKQACEAFGSTVMMTSPHHNSGTDRMAEVATRTDGEVYVNVQGDEPFVDPEAVDLLIRMMRDNPAIKMGTLKRPYESYDSFVNPNLARVVCDKDDFALYFSRAPIPPMSREEFESSDKRKLAFKHVGIYSFRREFLLEFAQMPPSPLEKAERLEQLRALEAGVKIKVLTTNYESISVETPADLERVRALFARRR
ncbi:MAG: 3-deoxy-manno-octulosonate cytidylyltransferase [Candidatus Abyssobacteria bacterium SURF_17]|uniref:3-deoxy-manno-octulosonate cytidylyltransferase n=1 Tax=Candidatus Abyssobacteria bacterium SURF_17 TaxID=2093361 RepID=A0A419EV65_9BACT|nr:MAG: 3-deoxy-manno-octulosonate cytidylyltransferase [Candidatus Abyssubacteria bacterium SURF_17]